MSTGSVMDIAQYSTAYSTYSVKTAVGVSLLKREMDSASDAVTGILSAAMDNTVTEINKTAEANPLSSKNIVDINI